MFGAEVLTLGIALALVGVSLLLIAGGLTRTQQTATAALASPLTMPRPEEEESPTTEEGIIVVLQGGRVHYLNARARQWFGLYPNDQPSLELLARRVRPQDDFFHLCTHPGKARLTLATQTLEATSYAVPYQQQKAIVLTLRPLHLLVSEKSPELRASTTEALEVFSELSQQVGAHLHLPSARQAAVAAVDRLLPSDVLEITLWDETHTFLIPYRYTSAGAEIFPENVSERYEPNQGLTGYLVQNRQPLLIRDLEQEMPVPPAVDRRRYPVRGYLGVPLLFNDEVIGTLEVASFAPNAYHTADLELLTLLAGPIAVALRNAQVFSQTQRQLQELRSLAEIAAATGEAKDPQRLIERLVHTVAPLLAAEIVGFLLYDEAHRLLQAQKPFVGLPEGFVSVYRAFIPAGSPAERLLQRGEPLRTDDASEDPQWQALGLADLSRTAGIRSSVLYPLWAGSRFLGFLQVANKPRQAPFTNADILALAHVVAQVTPVLENALLFRETRQRAQRAEALRRIASLAASHATLDEAFKFSVLELAHLVDARYAAVLLFDEEQNRLLPHLPSVYGIPPAVARRIGAILGHRPDFHFTVTRSGRPFLSNDISQDKRVISAYETILNALPDIRSAIAVPLRVGQESVGEILLGHPEVDHFDHNDLQMALTTAAQMALVVEREHLLAQSDANLRQQVEELRTMARIGRELSLLSSQQQLLAYAYQQMAELTQADCGYAFLLTAEGQPGLRVGETGAAGLHPLERSAIQAQTAQRVDDFQNETAFPQPHEEVRAALVLPLVFHNRVLGVAHLHAHKAYHFDASRQRLASLLAQHVAAALGAAQQTETLRQENQRLQRQIHALQRLRQFLAQHAPLEHPFAVLDDLVTEMQHATGFDAVLLARYEPTTGMLQPLIAPGFVQADPLPLDSLNLLLEDRFHHDGVYFIPAEARPPLPHNLTLPVPERPLPRLDTPHGWQAEDILLAPLRTDQGEPLGVLLLQAPRDGNRPDEDLFAVLRLFAAQAAWLLQVQAVQQAWETERQRLAAQATEAQEAAHIAQRDLPRWLRKDLQQALDRYTLARRAERLQVGLEITTLLNRQPSRDAVLNTLGQQLLERMGFNHVLIGEPATGENGQTVVRLVRTFGEVPSNLKLDLYLGQRNPLDETMRQRSVLIVNDMSRDQNWERSPLLQHLHAQSFIAFPITVEQHIQAMVLAISQATLPTLSDSDAQIFDLLGHQVGIVLQNLSLLARTSRRLREADLLLTFSRQLGVLDPERILNTLMESTLGALPSAHAGFIAMWDETQRVLLPRSVGGYAQPEAIFQITLGEDSLPAQVMLQGQPRRIAELDFATAYPLDTDALLAYHRLTAERMPVSSMMVPIRTGERALGVIVLDNFNAPDAFSMEDQMLVASLAQQTALTLENAYLLHTAEQRAAQLQALAQASSEFLAHSRSEEEVVASLLERLAEVLPYDGGTLWLREGERLTVRDARGLPNAEELLGVSVAVEDSRLFQDMLASRQPLVVPDTHQDDRFPAAEAMPNRSWLGVPLRFEDRVLGVIALEKREPRFYTADWVQTAATFASQAAAALINAQLLAESLRRAEELDRRSQRLGLVYQAMAALSASLDPQHIANYTAEHLHRALGGIPTSVVLWEDEVATVVAESPPAEKQALPQVLPAAPIFAHLAETRGLFRSEHYAEEPLLAPLTDFFAAHHAQAVVALPLVAGQALLGTLFFHLPDPDALTGDEVALAQTIAHQAAIALHNAHLYETTRRFSEELEARVAERTQELQQEHHRAQTLLRIITELSASLDLDQVLSRTLGLLNEALSAEQSTVLLRKEGQSTLFYRAGQGYTDPPPLGGRPTQISATASLAGWVIQHGEAVLIPDVREDPRWQNTSSTDHEQHRSALAVPLIVAQEVLGVLLLFHREPDHFTPYHLDLAQATAKQIAVAITNAELFDLIRDQAEHLGKLLRQQEVEASRAKAILEAIADGVLVTDPEGKITMFNPSAERILGVAAAQAVGQPLNHFAGLFGAAGHEWLEAISHWRQNFQPTTQPTSFAAQVELEDGRVISVHLAPVFFRREFLGSVAVFRDITHQVEVDRMKSEFVANVSHELRTPLTAIKGYVDLLLMGATGSLTKQQQHFLETVRANTQRLNLLVGDLLDISRIETGQVALHMQAVDLANLVREVVTEQARLAKEKGRKVHIEHRLPQGLPPVWGDPERLRQVIENLVENAYRYTPDGGRVLVTARQVGQAVQVDVSDTGIGIPPEEQERVFERFYRIESPMVMATPGTGLGLAIVKTLVERHGGRIWLKSTGVPGEGSTFSFTIPLAAENSPREA